MVFDILQFGDTELTKKWVGINFEKNNIFRKFFSAILYDQNKQ